MTAKSCACQSMDECNERPGCQVIDSETKLGLQIAICKACSGSGSATNSCDMCEGTGVVGLEDCPACHDMACAECMGSGEEQGHP